MRDFRHVEWFLPKLPLDIAIVRESIHKRTEYQALRPLTRHWRRFLRRAAALHRWPHVLSDPKYCGTKATWDRAGEDCHKATNQGVLPPWTGATVPPAETRTL